MIKPGDEVLVIAKVEAVNGHQLLVHISGHNIQITEDQLAHRDGRPLTR